MGNRAKFGVIVAIVVAVATASLVVRSRAGGVSGMQWTQIGPQPLEIDAEHNYQGTGPDSGEVADIAVDPRGSKDQIIFIATEAGGIWQSTDAGNTWHTTFDQTASLSTGAVALDPGNPSIVYAGTGNPTSQGFFKGAGVYKSIDDGQTWTLAPMTGTSLNTGNIGVNRIVLPAPGLLLVATNAGLVRSTDGGNTSTGVPVGGTMSYINDIHRDTATATTVYAAVQGTGIFQSTDSGATWGSNLFTGSNGSPVQDSDGTHAIGFIAFAQSTTHPGKIWASVQNVASGRPSNYFGLYMTSDGGTTWAHLNGGGGADAGGRPMVVANAVTTKPSEIRRMTQRSTSVSRSYGPRPMVAAVSRTTPPRTTGTIML